MSLGYRVPEDQIARDTAGQNPWTLQGACSNFSARLHPLIRIPHPGLSEMMIPHSVFCSAGQPI